ncbi:hypothetical protein HYU10_03080 [Candidatus Woesearchaeota archaeon]|nr:hypothetical protein [Candidatus Woesearchaeota archaeon]MBI2661544.1 hypothetical protein [Candidatus Woesearchaeota archaeon]
MANNDILSAYDSGQRKQFRNDFQQVARVSFELEKHYARGQHDLTKDIRKFEEMLKKFSKKYGSLLLKLAKAADSLRLRIFADEKSIGDFFANCASRMAGLKAIGLTGFNQAEATETEKFASLAEKMKDSVFVTYSDANSGTSTLAAVFDRKEKRVEILYQLSELFSTNSADFRAIAFYGLQKVDARLRIDADMSQFGFVEIMTEDKAHEFYDRFNPRFPE